MNRLIFFIIKINNFINTRMFIVKEKILSWIFCKRRLNIIFSKKDAWQTSIIKGFNGLPHKIFFSELNKACSVPYDLVVPLNIEDIFYLNDVGSISNRSLIPIPKNECVALCNDKYLFAQKMIANGFKDYIPSIDEQQKYPFLIKKRIDTWSKNTHMVLNKNQEIELLEKINSNEYYKQECIYGSCEYAAHIVFINKIICHINIKHYYANDLPIQGKQNKHSKIVKCKHLDLFSSILNSIGYEGLCCIDYKIKEGMPMIFEINPRFGGSLAPYFFSLIRHLEK